MGKNFANNKEISLNRYLQDNITVEDFFQVIGQILGMLVKLQGEGMQILLDVHMMKILNGKIQFQMSAEDSIYEMEKIKSFLKELAFCAVFDGNEECQKVVLFLHYLDQLGDNCSVKTIYDYCNRDNEAPENLYSGSAGVDTPTPDGETGVLGVGFWKDLEQKYQKDYPEEDAGETGILDPNYWNRISGDAGNSGRQPRLVNVRNGQAVSITKDNFWIGKEDVDLLINKDTISRKHAVIVVKNGHYFVMDNGSTNKTFVDGHEISPKASVEIYGGTRIKFANEEYEFQI